MTAAAAIALLAATAPAQAGNTRLSGNDLLKFCEGDTAGRMFCSGFVFGIGQLMQHLDQRMPTMMDDNGVDGHEYLTWCPASGMTTQQTVDIVVRELRAEPEHRHEQAYALVMVYLGAHFPCGGS